jgi:carboxyl-terminal processing protease
MENKRPLIWLPLAFALIMIAGMFLGYQLRGNMPWSANALQLSRKGTLDQVIELIRNRYVDNVDTDSLNDAAIDAMLQRLDPHSVYIPARQLQGVNEDLAGRFEGIGVEFNIFDDTVHIINVLKDGPSDKAGIHAGDRIIAVGDSAVAGNGITSDKIRSLLRGPGASKVDVTMLRGKEKKLFTISRGFIPLRALDAAYMPEPGTGYIRVNKFAETTYREFMEALDTLEQRGMKNLILDLRDNGGGILEEAIQMADEFLSGDKLIVYTEGKHNPRKEYRCQRNGIFEDGKLIVLINEGSASASEVLTGALQDWGRATIIGRRSFGKGLVQEQYNLQDGGGLRLTVARYFTPLGRSIQKPYDKGVEVYQEEILQRYHNGRLVNADSNKLETGEKFTTAGGKILFGGGGITPDLFVALDTTNFDSSMALLYRKNTMGNFVYRYYISHRSAFDVFKDPAAFDKGFVVNDALLREFDAFAQQDSANIHLNNEKSKHLLSLRLKSLLARQIWRTEGYYEMVNAQDPVLLKALDFARGK